MPRSTRSKRPKSPRSRRSKRSKSPRSRRYKSTRSKPLSRVKASRRGSRRFRGDPWSFDNFVDIISGATTAAAIQNIDPDLGETHETIVNGRYDKPTKNTVETAIKELLRIQGVWMNGRESLHVNPAEDGVLTRVVGLILELDEIKTALENETQPESPDPKRQRRT